jgi:hypothetical protein
MARPRKTVGVEASGGDQCDVAAIVAGIEGFKARYPDEWEALRLCPLQHGLETMIEKLAK